MWIGYIFSKVILGVQNALGKHPPRGISPTSASVTELVAGNTAADRNFLTFHNFRIVPALLRCKTPKRSVEVGQLESGDSVRDPWFFDVALDCFRRLK
jgi:hypothetical protein